MPDTMSSLKLFGLAVAWVFAAIAISVVTAMVLTELLDLVGVVDSAKPSYGLAINVIALVVFVPLVALPLFLRKRTRT